MRFHFSFNKTISDDFKKYMSINLPKIGGVMAFDFGDSYIDVVFRTNEDDCESIIELSETQGYFLMDDFPRKPRVTRFCLLSSLFIFVLSLSILDNLKQTFLALVIFLFCGNKIINYAYESMAFRFFSVALFSTVFSFIFIICGVYSFVFPRYDYSAPLFGSFIMTCALVYYYVFDNKGDKNVVA